GRDAGVHGLILREPPALSYSFRVRVGVVRALLALAALLAPAVAGANGPSAASPQRVTLIGDSVASALLYDQTAVAILAKGVDLRLEVAPCRRLGGESCPYQGTRPPNAIQLIQSLGPALGQTVIVDVGYNDFETEYAGYIEDALSALKAAGVQRVL